MEHLLNVLAEAARDFPIAPEALPIVAEALPIAEETLPNADSPPPRLAEPRDSRSRSRERVTDPYTVYSGGIELEDAVLEQAQMADLRWSYAASEDQRWNYAATEPPSPDDEPKPDDEPASASSGHPWEVASATRGRSRGLSEEERQTLKEEERVAQRCGVPWQDRGPAGEAPYWRGQGWRCGRDGGKERYANRGGKHREYYAELARSGRLVVKHTDPWKGISIVPGQGKPSEKGKSEKGKSKGKSEKGKSS